MREIEIPHSTDISFLVSAGYSYSRVFFLSDQPQETCDDIQVSLVGYLLNYCDDNMRDYELKKHLCCK